uniref:hypothetical protein n=1 Tax=Microseira wollei TaxID=467598 RepID=UPI001CFCEABE|nr:hypothetical protein [Microseira wollei]
MAAGEFSPGVCQSLLVAIAVTAFQIITSAIAGYALARLNFPGRQPILLIVLATLVIPLC